MAYKIAGLVNLASNKSEILANNVVLFEETCCLVKMLVDTQASLVV